jgi:hypothetical protein
MLSPMEKAILREKSQEGRRTQLEAVTSAVLKLQMLDLTPENGMVQCPPPANIDPLRWRAMVRHYFYNEGTT